MVLVKCPQTGRKVRNSKVSAADLVVLSLLAEEPMHGYRIVAELDRRDAQDWAEISRPQVYYSLKKLLKLKLITTAADSEEAVGPEREKYKITKTGLKEMSRALSETSWALQRPPPPFLTWMALSSHLSPAASKEVIKARRKFLKTELEREEKTLEAFDGAADKMLTAGKLMVLLTVEQFRAELKWLESVLRELPQSRSHNVTD